MIIPAFKLKKANDLIEAGDYDAAYVLLEEIERNDIIIENKYNRANKLIESGEYISAYKLLDGLNYKDSEEKIQKRQLAKYKQLFDELKVGDKILFGTYEQDGRFSDGKENIEWQVLDEEEGKILVISKYALDCRPYNSVSEDITWEKCTLRKWLNDDFINAAFTKEERKMIPAVTVSAAHNYGTKTDPGNNSQDQIFLLGIQEVIGYFASYKAMMCQPTEYAVVNNAYKSGNGSCRWWLRSPGSVQSNAAYVGLDRGIYSKGHDVNSDYITVRPAMWIDLNLVP